MFHARDHQTAYLIDPWDYLGPKRRKRLDESWAGLFREHILPGLPVQRLASCYTEGFGRPGKEIYAALGALILQQMHDLTDEETVSQFSFNLQWHYALDIPGESDESKYLCAKTLWTLRQRVTERGLDRELFHATTGTLAKVFGVDASRQRLDSVHIRSNMRRLGRIGIFSQGIHAFLVNLRRKRPLVFETVEGELRDRYLTKKALGCFSLVKPSEAAATLASVSRDLFSLVQRFRGDRQVTSLASFGILRRILEEQCEVSVVDGEPRVTLKESREIFPSSLQNPSDPEAGYDAHKGQGYQVQVMETYCDSAREEDREKRLNLITHVEVEPAHRSDAHALLPALESTRERGLSPESVLADSLYGGDENHQKAEAMGVEVIAPVPGMHPGKVLPLSSFPQTEKGKILACPQGHAPVKVKQGGKGKLSVAFASEHCVMCPLREQCPVRPGKKRHYLRVTLKALRNAGRRAREQTEVFRERYRWRAGIEATFSEMDRTTGIKRLRVRGLAAVGYCVLLKAIGVNIFRATRVKRALQAFRTRLDSALIAVSRGWSIFKERFLRYEHRFPDCSHTKMKSRTGYARCAA